MPDNGTYAFYAVMCEISRRELRRRIGLFPEEKRSHVVMAKGIIGAENAKRIEETPPGLASDGAEFLAKMMDLADHWQGDEFREVLELCLIDTMKDELSYRCPNCRNFTACLDLENTPIGDLFRRRAECEENEELKKETTAQVAKALQHTPHLETDCAHLLCENFRHQYMATDIGEVFNRYADIAAAFQISFGTDYRRVQQEMVRINMDFVEKIGQKTSGDRA